MRYTRCNLLKEFKLLMPETIFLFLNLGISFRTKIHTMLAIPGNENLKKIKKPYIYINFRIKT